jgi:hypothetical protein
MAGKLKGFDPKKLAVDHGEKIAFGVIVLLVLAALVTTNWMPYPKAPEDITRKVDEAQSKLAQGTWPQDEQQKFVLTEEREPEQVIDAGLHRRIEVAAYTPSQRMAKPLHDLDNPLQEPVLIPVRKMIATQARVFVEERPDPTELASATEGTPGEGTGTTPDPMKDENVSDEFRQRGAGAGAAGAGYPGGGYPGYGGGGIAGMGGEVDYGSSYAPELEMASMYGGMDYLMGGMMMGGEGYGPGMGTGPKVKGRGYPFVSVRGVFEYKDQVRKIAEAIHKPEAEAYQKFEIVDFELQRQMLEVAPDTWSDWEEVQIQVLRDVINSASGLAPDPVQSAVTDSAITCPLPQRVFGAWFNQATHPDLKEFQLSESEMEQELKFNYALIQSFMDSKKDLPPEPVKKKGFSDMVFDARQLQQGMLGSESSYDMMGMGGMMYSGEEMMGMGAGMGGSLGAGYPGAGGYGAGGYGAQGAVTGDKDFQKLVDDLAKVLDPEAKDKQLREFIAKRAKAAGSRLLFRYIDFDVVPGRTYQYRVRLELRNPNFGANIAAAGGQADVVAGETRMTPWSEPTAPTLVEDTVKYFVTRVEPARGTRLNPDVRMNVFQYDQQMGTIVNSQVSAAFGHNVGGKTKARQADPAQQTNEEKEYTFKSNDVLIDAVPDLKFGAPEHADLKLPPATRGYALAAELALLVTPDQTLKSIDPASQTAALADAEKHYNDQMAFMETLIRTAPAYGEGEAGDLASLYEGMYGGMEGEMGSGGRSRGRNPLKRGRGGSGGMMGMDGMGMGSGMMPPGGMMPGGRQPGRGRGGAAQRNPR